MSAVITPSMEKLAKQMKRHAETGIFDGRTNTLYFESARREDRETMTVLLYTRDTGMHRCGWFKNPDYDRCYHLSISFWDFSIGKPRPYEPKLAQVWCTVVSSWQLLLPSGICCTSKSLGYLNQKRPRMSGAFAFLATQLSSTVGKFPTRLF